MCYHQCVGQYFLSVLVFFQSHLRITRQLVNQEDKYFSSLSLLISPNHLDFSWLRTVGSTQLVLEIKRGTVVLICNSLNTAVCLLISQKFEDIIKIFV